MTESTPRGPVLRLQPSPLPPAAPGHRVVVTDTTWTAMAGDAALGLREVADRVLVDRDFIVETSALLDDWADAAGVAERMTVNGTSFWFRDRLGAWLWLQETSMWLAIADALIAGEDAAGVEVAAGVDDALASGVRRVAARHGLPFTDERGGGSSASAASTDLAEAAGDVPEPATAAAAPARRRGLLGRIYARLFPDATTRRIRALRRRIAALGAERPRRLLVLLAAAPQRVDTPNGPRLMNAYLGPVVDRLRGSALEPIELELRASYLDDADWERLAASAASRTLPGDALRLYPQPDDSAVVGSHVDRVVREVRAIGQPLVVAGIDLGPELVDRVAGHATRTLRGHVRAMLRAERLLRDLQPAGVLLVDEYHRQDWTSAAAAAAIPTAAIQHGLIYERHNGYAHRSRPSFLRLPSRFYTFGRWERDLLVERSVYEPEEVVVGGSPRLSLLTGEPVDREAVRAELGVAPGDRLVVVSGTWGEIYRRFHYPIALAHLVDRPLPGVHLVIKLHPAERDEGPYRAAIEGAATAGGFAPPKVTVVQKVDLYRLLAASDAHLGVHSTVLTEAVAAGTLNLLAATVAGPDLLGYVDAGVAVPVRTGGEVLDALERRDALMPSAAARQAFLDLHFEPGDGAARIADDLLAWLA